MTILLSKLLAFLIYPLGMFSLLLLVSVFLRLTGSPKSARFLIFLSIILIFVTTSPQTANWLTSHLERQHKASPINQLPAVHTIVMLGGVLAPPIGSRKTAELVASSDRMLHSSRLLKSGKAKQIYLSGGNVFDGFLQRSESDYARTLLVEWGVPMEKIAIGEASRTTYENAIETKNYLTQLGLIGEPILLVTSAIHMPRAVETFRAAGIKVIPAATDIQATPAARPEVFTWLPSAGALLGVTQAWHELVGLWYYRLRGWA